MKYVPIRIDNQTLEQLKDVNKLLDAITYELEELAKEDKNYKDIANDARDASAALYDFLTSYQREVTRD